MDSSKVILYNSESPKLSIREDTFRQSQQTPTTDTTGNLTTNLNVPFPIKYDLNGFVVMLSALVDAPVKISQQYIAPVFFERIDPIKINEIVVFTFSELT